MAAPLRLYFVRHGETAWSLTGQHTGLTDLPLTERGEDEARELRPWLEAVAFKSVFRSPRQRAGRTYELMHLPIAAEIVAELQEWNYGEYEGLTSESIRERRPGWDIFSDGCPGGESPARVTDRADRLIRRLRALEGNIALFSHGEFGRVLAARWIGAPVTLGRHLAMGTASLSTMTYESDHPETPVIGLWNAVPATLARCNGAEAEPAFGSLSRPPSNNV